MNNKHILLCGVGGQGVILSQNILSLGITEAGYDIKVSEIRGLAQRGGSVYSEVIYGDKVFSPIIENGCVDIILSFDFLETFKYINKLKPNGKIIVNTSLTEDYNNYNFPDNVSVKYIDSQSILSNIDENQISNFLLLGILIKELDLQNIDWIDIINKNIKNELKDLNIQAFNLGLNYK